VLTLCSKLICNRLAHPCGGANDEDHDGGGDGHGGELMIKCSGLEKGEREEQKAQGKGIFDRSSLFLEVKTLSECDHI